jgi:hypothetical protein
MLHCKTPAFCYGRQGTPRAALSFVAKELDGCGAEHELSAAK